MSPDDTTSPSDVKVAGLFYYPIKSLRGIALEHAELVETGLLHDRGWMLVDGNTTPAQFVTQRELPALATLSVQIEGDNRQLWLRHGEAGYKAEIEPDAPAVAVKVWKSDVFGFDAGDAAAAWLQQQLGHALAASADLRDKRLRLVRFDASRPRYCSTTYGGDSGAHTQFADGYPVLVCNSASLEDLNARMVNSLPMNRFRPNIVLDGLPAWEEDFIEFIHIGDTTLKLVKPCARCIMTTTDQESGARLSDEPLVSLSHYRNNPEVGGVTFGWNAIVVKTGALKVGERAEIEYRF